MIVSVDHTNSKIRKTVDISFRKERSMPLQGFKMDSHRHRVNASGVSTSPAKVNLQFN